MNTEYSSSKLACWSLCKSTEECNWFSYDIEFTICNLFKSCPEIGENSQFISGQKECAYEYGEITIYYQLLFCFYSRILF